MSEEPVDRGIPATAIALRITPNMIMIDNAVHSPEDVLEAADRWRRRFIGVALMPSIVTAAECYARAHGLGVVYVNSNGEEMFKPNAHDL